MCGVIGYVGTGKSPLFFFEGLKRLEYRGYDSAGIAMVDEQGIHTVKAEGKLDKLKGMLGLLPEIGIAGIGHTRWATHGKPSKENAHPHQSGPIVLLHNGIIENYQELKEELLAEGYGFLSETDTEVVVHLLAREFERIPGGSPHDRMLEALSIVLSQLKGAYAFAILCEEVPGKIYLAKLGSPLVVGKGEGENFIASGIAALVGHASEVAMLEDGDRGYITPDEVILTDTQDHLVEREFFGITWSSEMLEKGKYTRYMEKEIYEHPAAVVSALAGRVRGDGAVDQVALGIEGLDLASVERIHFIGCGSSYFTSLFAKYLMEELCHIPVEVSLASEYRYRASPINKNTLAIAISQSGETIDTLFAVRAARERGARTLALVNAQGSSIGLSCDATILMNAGPEIAVASTKALTSQMSLQVLLALSIAESKGTLEQAEIRRFTDMLSLLPELLQGCLVRGGNLEELGTRYRGITSLMTMGRGAQWPIALEAALKVKELSYIPADAQAGGELKHGPIALVDERAVILAIAPRDRYREKMLSNISEVKARGGRVIGIGTEGDEQLSNMCETFLSIPEAPEFLLPFLTLIPIHLFSYWLGVKRGNDVDQPRNLAKSVTVE